MRATATRNLDAGMMTCGCLTTAALCNRASISAIGSFVIRTCSSKQLSLTLVLPTRLDHAGNVPFQGIAPEADTAQFEPTHKPARPSALGAAIADAIRILAMQLAINA